MTRPQWWRYTGLYGETGVNEPGGAEMAAIDEVFVRTLGVGARVPEQVPDFGASHPDGALLETMLGRYLLDADGRKVWNLLDGRRTVGDIAAAISAESGLPLDHVRPRVMAFCKRLAELGLSDPAASPR